MTLETQRQTFNSEVCGANAGVCSQANSSSAALLARKLRLIRDAALLGNMPQTK